MIQKSVILMTNTTTRYDVVGEPFRADNWFGYTDGLHTVSVNYVNFKGNFHIQGSLSTDPADETSWFDIDINSSNNDVPYIEFDGESGISAFSFVGNFTFIRAIMNRSERTDLEPYSGNSERTAEDQGLINQVLLAM